MTIQELKSHIENKNIPDELIILHDTENGFISNQYISAIADVKNVEITYIDSLDGLMANSGNIFQSFLDETEPSLNVLKTEVFMWDDASISRLRNLIIVVSKFQSKTQEKMFEPHIVSVPKIEDWMLKDYVYSVVEGIDHKDLDWLMQLCGKNYYRLQQELDKLMLFRSDERPYLFTTMIRDGAVNDLSSYGIFNFTNAIVAKDMTQLLTIYKELDRMDVNEFGLLTILLKNFRNLVVVQLTANPTPESTGLDSKQLYAVKRIPRVYTAEQLVSIYHFLLDLDRQIKMGELPVELLIDYIVTKILSM